VRFRLLFCVFHAAIRWLTVRLCVVLCLFDVAIPLPHGPIPLAVLSI
jgi:hypothetical protein